MNHFLYEPPFPYVLISLDGTAKSTLQWEQARILAKNAQDQNQKILWNIDLGLFTKLHASLTHHSQFLTLRLALEHFLETLFAEFKESTLGAILYEGPLDFLTGFPWDDAQDRSLQEQTGLSYEKLIQSAEGLNSLRLFCQDVCANYLEQLVLNIPDALPLFILLDPSTVNDPYLLAHLMNPERYPRFHLLFSKPTLFYPERTFVWQEDQSEIDMSKKIGVCWPTLSVKNNLEYMALLGDLLRKAIPFRFIPESFLTQQWDGLDALIFSPKSLSVEGKRKLRGFCAAGGKVVSIGEIIGLADEMIYADWIENQIGCN